MTDARTEPAPPSLRWATEEDMGKPGFVVDVQGNVRNVPLLDWFIAGFQEYTSYDRPAVLCPPPDLEALAERLTNAIAGCEPTDWEENYAAILEELRKC